MKVKPKEEVEKMQVSFNKARWSACANNNDCNDKLCHVCTKWEQQEDKPKDTDCVNHIWNYSQLLTDPPINKRTCVKCNRVEFEKNGQYVTADVELQDDKPKKLKLRLSAKRAKRLQETLCEGCTDTTACVMCIFCLDRYVKEGA